MQTPRVNDDLTVSFFCKSPDSKGDDDCPSFYRTDRASWIVQGDRRGEDVAVQLQALKEHETFLEIPDGLADRFVRMYVKERYGIDLC
jgi:hypothetical protein